MRRLVVFTCFGAVALHGAGCSSSNDKGSSPPAGDAGGDADTSWDRAVTRPADSVADANRAPCKYSRGSLPAETLAASSPVDTAIPIPNIVVLTMETHSIHSYYA